MTQINFTGEAHIREALGVTPSLGARVLIDPTAVVMGEGDRRMRKNAASTIKRRSKEEEAEEEEEQEDDEDG